MAQQNRRVYMKNYMAARRAKLAELNLCAECGKAPRRDNSCICTSCAERAAKNELRRRIKHGWTGPYMPLSEEEIKQCWAQKYKIKHASRIEAGLCPCCGKEQDSYTILCNQCEENALTCMKMHREQRKAVGLCTQCGKEKENKNYTMCDSCKAKQNVYQKMYQKQQTLRAL